MGVSEGLVPDLLQLIGDVDEPLPSVETRTPTLQTADTSYSTQFTVIRRNRDK